MTPAEPRSPDPKARRQGASGGRLLSYVTLAVVSLAALAVLAGCGGGRAGGPDSGASGSAAKLEPAKDFQISPYDGSEEPNPVMLTDLLDRPLVLNFWAGLCPPCRAEMPEFQEFYDAYGDQVAVFGVDVGPFTGLGSNQTGRGLIKALNITYPTGSTEDASVVTDYGVFSMPTTVFITAEGGVFRTWSGILDKEKLIEVASDMLALSGDSLTGADA